MLKRYVLLALCSFGLTTMDAQTIGPGGVTTVYLGDITRGATKKAVYDINADHFKSDCTDQLHAAARDMASGSAYCGSASAVGTTSINYGFYHYAQDVIRCSRYTGCDNYITYSCGANMTASCSASNTDDPDGGASDIPVDCSAGACSPIVVDLGHNNFEFTGRSAGVAFDLDADGIEDRTAWTASDADDAFLVLDRNQNNVIDDGGELFGDATPQPAGGQRHGYRALALFDDNRDGVIDAADAVFASLRLWRDASHDGFSQANELASLSSAGVVSISLDPKESRRHDRYGNVLRYRADVVLSGTDRKVSSVDVFFVAK